MFFRYSELSIFLPSNLLRVKGVASKLETDIGKSDPELKVTALRRTKLAGLQIHQNGQKGAKNDEIARTCTSILCTQRITEGNNGSRIEKIA